MKAKHETIQWNKYAVNSIYMLERLMDMRSIECNSNIRERLIFDVEERTFW